MYQRCCRAAPWLSYNTMCGLLDDEGSGRQATVAMITTGPLFTSLLVSCIVLHSNMIPIGAARLIIIEFDSQCIAVTRAWLLNDGHSPPWPGELSGWCFDSPAGWAHPHKLKSCNCSRDSGREGPARWDTTQLRSGRLARSSNAGQVQRLVGDTSGQCCF